MQRMAITFDLEGANALNVDVSMVSLYYRLGVRQMLLAYNLNNRAGGACHDRDSGLTGFGREVIAEMNRVGMVVDCSHTGHTTTMQIMEMASQPVIFSHSNPWALRAHGRSITDEQIRACAKTGGVIGVTGLGYFLPRRPSAVEAFADCVDYVRDLVGVDHVGVGLDWAPPSPRDRAFYASHRTYWPASEYSAPWSMSSVGPADVRGLTATLVGRGWTEKEVRKVLGENFLRVARAVWK